jgi:protein-disulfide isomerase
MASRQAEKQRLREEREAREAADAAKARRDRRLRMLLIALGAAAVVVIVAIVVSTTGGDDEPSTNAGGPVEGAADVRTLFTGVEQDGFAMGDPDAPVTVVEFADLQCPFCRDAALGSLPTIINDYVKKGQVRVEFRNFAFLGPDSDRAARAAAEAANQNRAWQFIDLWFHNQGEENTGYATDDFIRSIASNVDGLDADKVVEAANGDESTTIDFAHQEAERLGVESTPTFMVGKTGQALQPTDVGDPSDPAGFKQAIEAALSGP